ncbi:MAG: YegP family protein [Bacteroidota bacterium]
MKFEIYQSEKSKEYYFRLKAGNGEKVLASEGYSQKAGAQNGVQSVMKNCSDSNCYEMKQASNGKDYFNLKSTNGQVIGTSQMYASSDGCKNGMDVVKKAGAAEIVDLTV